MVEQGEERRETWGSMGEHRGDIEGARGRSMGVVKVYRVPQKNVCYLDRIDCCTASVRDLSGLLLTSALHGLFLISRESWIVCVAGTLMDSYK